MAEQLEACAPIEPVVWLDDNGAPARLDPDVASTISQYQPSIDGKAFVVDGVAVPVSYASRWHSEWEIKNNDFSIWCANQLLVETPAAMKNYFGPTSVFLDFDERCVIWTKWFEAALEAHLNNTISLTTVFQNQIAFEHSVGYDFMGCPYLFPNRTEMMEIIGLAEDPGKPEVKGKHARVSEKDFDERMPQKDKEIAFTIEVASALMTELSTLQQSWRNYSESPTIINLLVEEAADRYVRGTYDRVEIFKHHRARIEEWANNQMLRDSPESLKSPVHKMSIDRLALATMVYSENYIMAEIAKRTNRQNKEIRRMDSARLNKLRAGSLYRP